MSLEKLSKEELIAVIAHMHDCIQDWDNGWGLNEKDAAALIKVGNLCAEHMIKTQGRTWTLPDIND